MDSVILILISALTLLSLSGGIAVIVILRKSRGGDTGARIAVLEERLSTAEADRDRLGGERDAAQAEIAGLRETLQDRDRDIASLEQDLAITRNDLRNEKEQNRERLQALKGDQEEMANRFKVLADGILKENARQFREQNAAGLGELLNPLKERLGEFQRKIQENYETEGKERHSLRNEVQKLAEMNARLSEEASNLTNALKGESKTQGNWGEMILERILEVSGLRKGEEYTTQESYTLEDGSRVQPDVVIRLPEDRYMVIDSKVSLVAYEEYMNAGDEGAQEAAMRQHIASVRTHMKGLASKEYQKLHDDRSPDFVIMFIPIEPAFMLAIAEDARLWEDAWKNDVLLVSSSTLLFVMRMVMQLWRQEYRSRGVQEIAQRGAALYEKFVGFVGDFEDVGRQIDRARHSFDGAKGKLVADSRRNSPGTTDALKAPGGRYWRM